MESPLTVESPIRERHCQCQPACGNPFVVQAAQVEGIVLPEDEIVHVCHHDPPCKAESWVRDGSSHYLHHGREVPESLWRMLRDIYSEVR